MAGRLYYGWVIVATLFVANFAIEATGALNLGLFVIPMSTDLGLSRSVFGWLSTARSVAGGASGVFIGRLLDRFGPRLLLAGASVITGLCLLGLGASSRLLYLFLLFGLIGLAGLAGAGGGMMSSVPVAKWFVRRRGMALALATLGLGIGAVTFLPVTQALIGSLGWRRAWMLLGGISMALIVPLSLLFLRRQPEDMGLHPDGDVAIPVPAGPHGSAEVEEAWSVGQVVRTRAFWLLTCALVLNGFAMGGSSVHRIPYWVELGFDPRLVSFSFSADAAGAALMALVAGFLLDRFPARFVAAGSLAGFAGAVALMVVASSAFHMFGSTVLFGMAAGTNMVIQTYIWASYYGRAFLGTIRGITMPAIMVAAAIGAPVVGYIYDFTGGYVPAWWLLIGVYGVAFLVMLTATPPVPRRAVLTTAPGRR